MRGDTNYTIFGSGSVATSAAPAHSLFGSNLASLSQEEVINVQLQPLGGIDFRIGRGTISSQVGLRVFAAASIYEMPPMRVAYASQLHIVREGSSDGSSLWNIWIRQ